MNKLCSILIPSRGNPAGLMRAIQSAHESANGGNYDVLVWLDDDDVESLKLLPGIRSNHRNRAFVGPRLGYDLLDRGYYTLLSYHSNAEWIWIMNDDMVVSGDWYNGLCGVELWDTFCQPELHKLGTSEYHKDNRSGSPLFRRNCWQEFGFHTVPAKADYVLTDRLEREGWQCHFLKGVTVWHDRNK